MISDPEIWANIVRQRLDQSIRDYAAVVQVCRLFSCLAREYLRRASTEPVHLERRVEMPSIPFTSGKFVIRLEAPRRKDQTHFGFAVSGRYDWAVRKHQQSIDSICRAVLYSHELCKFYDPLRTKIALCIAEYWRQTEAEQQRLSRAQFLCHAATALAQAEQRARCEFRRKRNSDKKAYRRAHPDRGNADVFALEFCLASAMPSGF